ncbi:response regulator transcription factor [Vulcanococcus sp. Clear-D1]|uniref:response regulator transcription factor n=1 Tax=Vulcanococcus sp. Clear-D1 TaxID=2766970 RepID=UPI0019988DD9|nr:response regulator transcription factor [Vulcanococcus sp. Clear-D1]MBD1192959.1 response regulator transcription factor [Vulcanococcus sp. Clear-D1]
MTASPPAIPEALRCLIVEDQVMFLQLLCSMLEAMPGLTVVGTATRQADAIALCSGDDAPDLLILDLALPDGDGLAVAQALAAVRPHAKVVVLSGQASSFVCPGALQPLIVGVVDKTSAFAQLTQVLERCLPHSADPLTPRQQEIYGLIGQGLTNKEIARASGLSVTTVETHRKAIAQKLGVSGSELVRQASLRGRLNTVEG